MTVSVLHQGKVLFEPDEKQKFTSVSYTDIDKLDFNNVWAFAKIQKA